MARLARSVWSRRPVPPAPSRTGAGGRRSPGGGLRIASRDHRPSAPASVEQDQAGVVEPVDRDAGQAWPAASRARVDRLRVDHVRFELDLQAGRWSSGAVQAGLPRDLDPARTGGAAARRGMAALPSLAACSGVRKPWKGMGVVGQMSRSIRTRCSRSSLVASVGSTPGAGATPRPGRGSTGSLRQGPWSSGAPGR